MNGGKVHSPSLEESLLIGISLRPSRAAQFTPKVTELVLAQLFFLSIDRANKPINVYVHSFGTQTPNKQVRLGSHSLLLLLDVISCAKNIVWWCPTKTCSGGVLLTCLTAAGVSPLVWHPDPRQAGEAQGLQLGTKCLILENLL